MPVVLEGLVAGLALPPDYTVSEWADAHVVLTSELAAEPGPYRSSRTPYAREMMDVLTDPGTEIVVYHTSAQVAKTTAELMGIGYHIHHDPCPMLMVLPTQIIAEAFSKAKLGPFLDGTEVLRDRVGASGSRAHSSTLFRKEFPGGFLNLAGANSPAGLAMQSVRIVWADEIDRFPGSAGKEGDPLLLAFKRAQTFANRKLVVSSTPTVKGMSRVDEFFEMSDQRYYQVPMPCCGAMRVLRWENVRWKPGHPETAEYFCSDGCGCLLSDPQIKLAVADPRARWVATKPFNGVAGFHLWQIYSPWSSLREIVKGYEETKHRSDLHEVWHNTTLGESWDQDETARCTPEAIYNARLDYHADRIPAGAACVVASVDVQGDRIEVLYVAYGADKRAWLLDHQKIFGDPTADAVWKRLEEALSRRFPHATHPHVIRPIEGVAIDSGYLSQRVYDFCAKAHLTGRPWYAVKGQSGEGKIAWSLSKQKLKSGAKLHNVGVDSLKTELYSRLASDDPRENSIYVRRAECFDLPWCEQMVAERVRNVVDTKGFSKREWFLPPGMRNEALDLMVYAEAVHRHLNIDHAGRLAAMQQSRPADLGQLAEMFN